MRIAVIGSGISGLASAWMLSQHHDVTLFEANNYFGGHTDTHMVRLDGRDHAVDTGFIVYNRRHYPWLTRMFDTLGVSAQPTTMSFSVHNETSGLEYSATSLDTLFCQRRNLLSPRFWNMLRDLMRFYREAPRLLEGEDPGPTLGQWLAKNRYGAAFRDEHIVPMASALWSSPATRILDFPARYLARFMANHHMLQVSGRPEWQVVRGGSSRYVHALRAQWRVHERPASPVRSVRRDSNTVQISSTAGHEHFDQVVLACHSHQALRLLADADDSERDVLGAIAYQPNEAVLHTDTSVLPRRRKAWAAWNARIPAHASERCTVSYCMNLLQGIQSSEPLIVTLNPGLAIDPARVLRRRHYEHPVYRHATLAAQARKADIQGRRRTWFAGAYWGWGFHEDGMTSAVEVARALDPEGWEAAFHSSSPRAADSPEAA